MFMSKSEDELEELHSDLDSESECSLDEEEYVPGGLFRGSDQDDFSDEDSSDEEWASKPKRKVSRKRCCSVTASPVSSPLKSPSRKQEVSPCRKKLHYASTPKKDTSTPNSSKTLSSPRGKNKSGKPAEKKVVIEEEDDVDGDRWCNIDEEDVEPLQPRFRPDRDVGPQLNRTANYTPLELFQLFFSMTVINTLVKNTNAYGKNKYQGQRKAGCLSQQPTCIPSSALSSTWVLYLLKL
ncbi:PiggyBac transposable element-derived protein 2 [Dissostichus eleginoides]|uniref:PiggyBac transposable element-derived protein 2 n=1 Tax=Dissostichus eleginoides TaxID=100907 RepID=A0AAD9BY16_DISEL|nr:PiggyBac transposable element-derived protein 2 [Dissostichus eleginoides]